jgi:hypothetical protein
MREQSESHRMPRPHRCNVQRGDAGSAVGVLRDGLLRRAETCAEEQAEGKHEEAERFHLPAL